MATCRDAARFGQLIVNGGRWLAADGSLYTLVPPDFAAAMSQAAFPAANRQYGLLAWLHPGQKPDGSPRARP